MSRRALAATVAAIAAFGAGAAAADASTYCVVKSGCAPTDTFVDLQVALNKATGAPGPDRIEIGPGTLVAPSGFTYTGSATNTIEIVGAGSDQTHLASATGGTNTALVLGHGTLSDVEVVGPDAYNVGDSPVALALTSGEARHVKLTKGRTGASLGSGAVLRESVVAGSGFGTNRAAVDFAGSGAVVEDTTIDAGGNLAVSAEGPGVSARITRSRLDAAYGVVAGDSTVTVDDSLLTGLKYEGVYAYSAATDVSVTLVGDTFAGSDNSKGVVATSISAGRFANVTLENTALSGFLISLEREAVAGGVFISASHSAFDPSNNVSNGFGSLDVSDGNVGAPTGLDAGYRPEAGSALIDAGKPDPSGGLSATDIAGSARSADGDGNGTVVPDIGAFERPAPVASQTPAAPAPDSGSPAAPAIVPQLSRVSFAPRRFAVSRSITGARRGTRVRFTLNEAARVRITFKRRGARRKAGSTIVRGRSGQNSVRFRGRVARRLLRPGRYVATFRATDGAGKRSARRRARFTIVR